MSVPRRTMMDDNNAEDNNRSSSLHRRLSHLRSFLNPPETIVDNAISQAFTAALASEASLGTSSHSSPLPPSAALTLSPDGSVLEWLAPFAGASSTALASQYAAVVPEHLKDNRWNVRRCKDSPFQLVDRFPAPDDDVRTLHDNFERSASRHPNEPFLGHRQACAEVPYRFFPFKQVAEWRSAAGAGLQSLLASKASTSLQKGSAVGLYAQNCTEWMIAELACHAYGWVPVPLYDTLGPDAVQYICDHAELSVVFTSRKVLPTLLATMGRPPASPGESRPCSSVRMIVVFDACEMGEDAKNAAEPLPPIVPGNPACVIVDFAQLIRLGTQAPKPHTPPTADAIGTICYTSGTTGVPKGAVLLHRNMIASCSGYADRFDLGPGDVHISYLPLAHIYERLNIVTATRCAFGVGFSRGDVTLLLDDIQVLRPTLFTSVPRLWNRIYDRIRDTINTSGTVKKALAEMALRSKIGAFEANDASGGMMSRYLWNPIVFSKMREKLGGRVRYATTGASPISRDVLLFLRACFGSIIEGYGMTETSCLLTMTDMNDTSTGHVGSPISCVEVKLDDVPEMNYTNADQPFPRGEICVRGPSVFVGYFKNPEATKEALDDEGWLHTGDIGMWIEGNRLQIIDRKKNLFKLQQGEYVAPEKIENVYGRSSFVAQSFVHGDSLRTFLVAIVVPDFEVLLPWAVKMKVVDGEAPEVKEAIANPLNAAPSLLKSVCESTEVLKHITKDMDREASASGLLGFERARVILLHHVAFSVENNMLTPTFKLKRPEARKAFASEIERMYAESSTP
ncbi:long chain acyl-CoA synthetase 7 peroxisomal [Pycnococcus provasolii]|uniref:Long-chain-fatty-acid--CoA ligase n=1 Tax=Pycnococcus provasolii TaxID=41880 RepID=A0A830HQW6_9CHLO|nr:long chain acyl-CoA synthetase 7 peroxisomal [Pycnococcus provasolii]